MKKIAIFALATILLLCLCACGAKTPADNGGECTTSTTIGGGEGNSTTAAPIVNPTDGTTTTLPTFTADNDDVFNDAELSWD